MKISENILLAPYTTFKIGGPARFFCVVENEEQLVEAVRFAKEKSLQFLVIGGGSNILVSDDGFGGLVIKNEIGPRSTQELSNIIGGMSGENTGGPVIITAGAGAIWDDLVGITVENGLYGLEDLSSIPGTVGAAPVQNIGAYGAEVSRVIESVRALDTESMTFVVLSNEQCRFGYRSSIFKIKKGRYVITAVSFRLSRNGKINIEYKDIQEYLKDRSIANPTLIQVRNAIINIRKDKLPDWQKWGTAGSFFKNPVVSKEDFDELRKKYPELPGYIEGDGKMKVSLGWILDKVCDAKGLVVGNVGTYEKQALVLVAKQGASATEVVNLSKRLMECVREKTGIAIEAEVEWVN